MSLLTTIRKGLGFVMMSMGVSTYAKKPAPSPHPVVPPVKPE
jgi:hypothetical protein